MSRIKGSRVADPSRKSVHLAFYPFTTHTVVHFSLTSGSAVGERTDRVASWNVRLTRADLAGHSTDDVIRGLLKCLLRSLESRDPANYRAASAVGIGAPLGATGGTVTTDHRQVVQPTLDDLSVPFPELSTLT